MPKVLAEVCRGRETEPLERLAKKLRAEIDKFAEMALEAPNDTRAVFFAKVDERQKRLADVEGRMRATCATSAGTGVKFAEVEREAREGFEKPQELVASYPAEVKLVVRALLLDSVIIARSAETDFGSCREERMAIPDAARALRGQLWCKLNL